MKFVYFFEPRRKCVYLFAVIEVPETSMSCHCVIIAPREPIIAWAFILISNSIYLDIISEHCDHFTFFHFISRHFRTVFVFLHRFLNRFQTFNRFLAPRYTQFQCVFVEPLATSWHNHG